MAERKIRAGYYRRYDGKLIYLVTAAEDAETGEETVILRSYSFSEVPQYFTLSKKSFCAFVEVNGERRSKYKRVTSMKITEAVISNLAETVCAGQSAKRARSGMQNTNPASINLRPPTLHTPKTSARTIVSIRPSIVSV